MLVPLVTGTAIAALKWSFKNIHCLSLGYIATRKKIRFYNIWMETVCYLFWGYPLEWFQRSWNQDLLWESLRLNGNRMHHAWHPHVRRKIGGVTQRHGGAFGTFGNPPESNVHSHFYGFPQCQNHRTSENLVISRPLATQKTVLRWDPVWSNSRRCRRSQIWPGPVPACSTCAGSM